MANDILLFLVGSTVTPLIAAGGWVCAYILCRDAKSQDGLKARFERLESEVNVRICLEEEACDGFAKLTFRPANL